MCWSRTDRLKLYISLPNRHNMKLEIRISNSFVIAQRTGVGHALGLIGDGNGQKRVSGRRDYSMR